LDGDHRRPVQDWIRETERRRRGYGCIVLCSCNPGSLDARASRALVFHPDRIIGGGAVQEIDGFSFTLVHPDGEEIDEYTFEYETARLWERIAARAARRNH